MDDYLIPTIKVCAISTQSGPGSDSGIPNVEEMPFRRLKIILSSPGEGQFFLCYHYQESNGYGTLKPPIFASIRMFQPSFRQTFDLINLLLDAIQKVPA